MTLPYTENQKKGVYKSHKAAIISSSDPFGLIADYLAPDGTIFGYLNGMLESVTKSAD